MSRTGIKAYYLNMKGESQPFYRVETKFKDIGVAELTQYFTNIDKRLAWESENFSSIEEVKSYPMKTSISYY